MNDELAWLQQWFLRHCDGEWEHGYAITIETLDNPGWHVMICLEGTELETVPFNRVQRETSDSDWIDCQLIERDRKFFSNSPDYRRFDGSGGPANLAEIIAVFHSWASNHA